jgi:hypothetical protein
MNVEVANLELCKELYELSNWGDCELRHDIRGSEPMVLHGHIAAPGCTPAYGLGYLLRKLPPERLGGRLCVEWQYEDTWKAMYYAVGLEGELADTPENALCKLAIELFKQGVLTRSEK